MCFVWIWEQRLFPYTELTDCLYNRDLTLYSPVVTLGINNVTFNNSTFCPHTVFMCFGWIWEQTAIISLYNINWPVFITETGYVSRTVRTVALYKTRYQSSVKCQRYPPIYYKVLKVFTFVQVFSSSKICVYFCFPRYMQQACPPYLPLSDTRITSSDQCK